MTKHMIYVLSVALLVLGLSGCGPQNTAQEEETSQIPVQVSTLQPGQMIQTLSYAGDVEAEFAIKVFSKVNDRVETFYVEEGDAVRKGNRIASILAETIEQSVRQAKASVIAAKAQAANAQLEFERAKRLQAENAMSQQQYDAIATQYEAAQAGLEQAEAALKTAKTRLDDALITAPISGIIGQRFYEEGDMVNPAMPVVTVVQMDRVKLSFDATESDLGSLKKKQPARLKVKSYPDTLFEGTVSKISPVLDPITRMATVEVLIDNSDHMLKPGMFGRITVTTGTLENVLVVPRYAVIENTTMQREGIRERVVKNYYAFVVQDSTARRRKLTVDYVSDAELAVTGGLETGEKLVVQGQNNLKNQAAVKVIEEANEQ